MKICTFSHELSLGKILGFLFTQFILYYILFGHLLIVLSINHLLAWIEQLSSYAQIIAMSIMPIYLAALIFGGGALGAKLGHFLQKKFSVLLLFLMSKRL